MSALGGAMQAIRSVLLLQDKVAELNRTVDAHAQSLARLADAHADLRDRVSRLEGVIDGVAMTASRRRITE